MFTTFSYKAYLTLHILCPVSITVQLSAVDDGTGVITCSRWKNKSGDEEDSTGEELGILITVHGRIRKYNDERQLIADYTSILSGSPNDDLVHGILP